MADIDEQILRWNPWWRKPEAVDDDPHLRALSEAPVRWDPPLLERLPIAFGDTHTLRGPRQAGKTTLAKRLIQRLVHAGEPRVLYFSLDLERSPDAVYDVLDRARTLHPDPDGGWYIFLDEVTSVPQWQRGVKVAWDQGLTRNDFLLLTGSSAHDLKTGAEQLPGRRGGGADFLHLPMSFRDFCTQVEGVALPAPVAALEALLDPDGRRIARELNLARPELDRAFAAYLGVGGFPAAIQDYRREGDRAADARTIRMLWSAIAGDVAKRGRDQVATAKLLEEVAVSLGSALKWEDAARAMGMAGGGTAKEYVEVLAESFALLAVHFWDLGGRSLQPGRQRKVYFMDPLLSEIAPMLMPGARRPSTDALVENAVAVALFRSSARALTQAGAVPGAIGYWRSKAGREIDFVVPVEQEDRGRGGRLPVEVKGDNTAAMGRARSSIVQAFGEGIITSRTLFDPTGPVPVFPAPVLLAALGDLAERSISVA
jgi:uncharacterized protein